MKSRLIKPWGYEEILECNENYTLKRIFMKTDHCCSLQFHIEKHETIYVLGGELKIAFGVYHDQLDDIYLHENGYFVIWNKLIHRMYGITDCLYLEASTSQLDDVVRLEDNYGRV
uniref:Putative mannose-6-phosphate isomerase n=1 Tax=viral metagenome TaxID=1070528 RepID=A0A6M3XHE6_9ZZZZ